ncbi:MAG: zinc dependent phospholipase C family protein [Oscillospiraceae bacterium]
MPALITHGIMGKQLFEALKSNEELNYNAFVWGAQGPDIFFYDVFSFKNLIPLSRKLHKENPAEFIDSINCQLENITDEEKLNATKSYMYGFISHVMLDFYLHPFVYNAQALLAQKINGKPRMMHHKIEHNLDVALLLNLGINMNAFDLKTILPKDGELFRLIEKTYNKTGVYRALKKCYSISNILYDRNGFKRKLVRGFEKLFHLGIAASAVIRPQTVEEDWDYVNISRNHLISEKTFFELFETAKEATLNVLINKDFNVLKKITYNVR